MISKLSVPLLALSICCALAQNQDSSNAEAQALSQVSFVSFVVFYNVVI
jgi:hypothetical protein